MSYKTFTIEDGKLLLNEHKEKDIYIFLDAENYSEPEYGEELTVLEELEASFGDMW